MDSGARMIAMAHGIMLRARVQALPGNEVDGSDAIKDWNVWVDTYGAEMALKATQEQYRLFDVVNGKSWRY